MAENTKGRHLLTKKDFVQIVDADGNDLPPVPKHWGADQLPAGAQRKSSGSSSSRKSAKKSTAKKTAASGGQGSGDSSDSGSGS